MNELLTPLENVIVNQVSTIEAWFEESWKKTPAPITSSVDLRNAGFKIAPVDTNLFPAGFNNLDSSVYPVSWETINQAIQSRTPGCKKIIVLPESHTRNRYYAESLRVLRDILVQAGFVVRIGSLDADIAEPYDLLLDDGSSLLIEPLIRRGSLLSVADFEPCLLLLNNDLSSGIPEQLVGIHQRIEPTANLGWASRLKSSHFQFFDAVASEFCELLALDPWLINPIFNVIDGIDFMSQTGLEALANAVDVLLSDVTQHYEALGIDKKPFVVVKADNGTYGMNVIMVHSGSELLALNRKQRTRMAAGKGGRKVERVIIQEGVFTTETTADNSVAEPVIYMMGPHVLGGFFRVHPKRGTNENLNAPGMHFETISSSQFIVNAESHSTTLSRFYVYGVIARLAALAAAREIEFAGR